MTERIAVRVIVRGKVQGVGFRAWTRKEASALGLVGWVRNLPDGTVEAFFQGDSESVSAMTQRCSEGPRFSEVGGVEIETERTVESVTRFDIK